MNTEKRRALCPPLDLLVKLGSIIVHADEYTSAAGCEEDYHTLRALLDDGDVRHWIKTMGPLLPLKRDASQ